MLVIVVKYRNYTREEMDSFSQCMLNRTFDKVLDVIELNYSHEAYDYVKKYKMKRVNDIDHGGVTYWNFEYIENDSKKGSVFLKNRLCDKMMGDSKRILREKRLNKLLSKQTN